MFVFLDCLRVLRTLITLEKKKKLTFVEEKEQDFLFEFFCRFIQGISSVECIAYGYKTLW